MFGKAYSVSSLSVGGPISSLIDELKLDFPEVHSDFVERCVLDVLNGAEYLGVPMDLDQVSALARERLNGRSTTRHALRPAIPLVANGHMMGTRVR